MLPSRDDAPLRISFVCTLHPVERLQFLLVPAGRRIALPQPTALKVCGKNHIWPTIFIQQTVQALPHCWPNESSAERSKQLSKELPGVTTFILCHLGWVACAVLWLPCVVVCALQNITCSPFAIRNKVREGQNLSSQRHNVCGG